MDAKLQELHKAAARRSGEERACRGKINYKSFERAAEMAPKLTAKFNTKELEPYPCPFCGGWHIGRKMSDNELQGP